MKTVGLGYVMYVFIKPIIAFALTGRFRGAKLINLVSKLIVNLVDILRQCRNFLLHNYSQKGLKVEVVLTSPDSLVHFQSQVFRQLHFIDNRLIATEIP